MAIKAGQILHDVDGFVVDRIQTGGVSSLNIPEEKIYELGNYQAVATVRDVADLSFDIESLDVSTEIESLILGKDPTVAVEGDEFDFVESLPMDVISPFKAGSGNFDIVKGVAVPYLTLESATYRFGVRQNSTQQYTFKGDAVYYIPGSPRSQKEPLASGPTFAFDDPALKYVESGDDLYALSVCVKNEATNTYKRLFIGDHYTNTATQLTLLDDFVAQGYDTIHFVYGTAVVDNYPQTVHEGVSVKPATVRGKDIDVY